MKALVCSHEKMIEKDRARDLFCAKSREMIGVHLAVDGGVAELSERCDERDEGNL